MIRLQKYLSRCGVASRRHAEELISEGKVFVNGKEVTELGTKIDPDNDTIRVGKRILKPEERGLILLNKPLGYLTTKSDPDGRPTVMSLVDKRFQSYFPVGRLDYNTSGILLLTNDGDLAEKLTHPRFGFKRVYRLKVKGIVTKSHLAQIAKGITLEDGYVKGQARITKNEGELTSVEIILKEGRNRIVRRMMDHFGLKIITLKRIEFGPFKLGTLKAGEYKLLKKQEYLELKAQVEIDKN